MAFNGNLVAVTIVPFGFIYWFGDMDRFKVVGEIYPAIIRKSSSQVIGILYENLSDGELKALDAFEGIEYCRVEVSVSSDHIVRPTTSKNSILTAFTYLWNGEVEKLQGEWTYEIDFLPYEQQFFPDL